MDTREHNPKEKDEKQASTVIAVCSIIGLCICFVVALWFEKEVPIILYGIFGGGILGTANVLNVIKSIFRIGK